MREGGGLSIMVVHTLPSLGKEEEEGGGAIPNEEGEGTLINLPIMVLVVLQPPIS